MIGKRIAMVAGAAVLSAVCGAAHGQPRSIGPGGGSPMRTPGPVGPARPASTPAPAATPTPAPAPLAGEYQEMAVEANMTANQQKAVSGIQMNEEKALAKFDQDHAKQLDGIKKNLADAQKRLDDSRKLTTDANEYRQTCQLQIDAINKQINLMAENKARVSHGFKVGAMSLFTPDQRAAWVSYWLNKTMTAEFMPVGLSADQQASVKAFCTQAGATATGADVSTNTDLQDSVRQQVVAILDDTQKLKYNQMLEEKAAKAAAASPTP